MEVGLSSEKVVDIKADKSHSLGMICRRSEYAPEIIYSENRLNYTMKRVGSKGTYEFKKNFWDEAYNEIVKNLNKIKSESGPEAVSIYTGRGSFDVIPVEILDDGSLRAPAPNNIDFVGGIDVWSQGYNLLAFREGWPMTKVFVPSDTGDTRRPKSVVFIPPEYINTEQLPNSENPEVY